MTRDLIALIAKFSPKCLEIDPKAGKIVYKFPEEYYSLEALESLLKKKKCSFQLDVEEGVAELRLQDPAVEETFRKIFSELNGLPYFSRELLASFKNSSRPRVSCIFLLTFNGDFVKNLALPSLIHSSQNQEIEIILVYNGAYCSLEEFSQFKTLRSDFGWVARGYNAGVRGARGEYVAIFHDDCLIDDPFWIDKAVSSLKDEVWAVTPSLLPPQPLGWTAKDIPLVMRKEHYEQLGGYDENYYFGIEDTDFTYKIFSKNKKVEELDLKHFHGSGMSTLIACSDNPKMYQKLFGLNALPLKWLKILWDLYFCQFKKMNVDFARTIQSGYVLYFLDKFKELGEKVEVADFRKQCEAFLAENRDLQLPYNQPRDLIPIYKKMVTEYPTILTSAISSQLADP